MFKNAFLLLFGILAINNYNNISEATDNVELQTKIEYSNHAFIDYITSKEFLEIVKDSIVKSNTCDYEDLPTDLDQIFQMNSVINEITSSNYNGIVPLYFNNNIPEKWRKKIMESIMYKVNSGLKDTGYSVGKVSYTPTSHMPCCVTFYQNVSNLYLPNSNNK